MSEGGEGRGGEASRGAPRRGEGRSTSSSKSHSCASPSLWPLPLLPPLPPPRACCAAREPTEVTSSVPRTLTATKGRVPRSFLRPRTCRRGDSLDAAEKAPRERRERERERERERDHVAGGLSSYVALPLAPTPP